MKKSLLLIAGFALSLVLSGCESEHHNRQHYGAAYDPGYSTYGSGTYAPGTYNGGTYDRSHRWGDRDWDNRYNNNRRY